MKRKTRKRVLSVTALAISAVLILFRTALLSCADDPEDGEKTLPAISVSNLVLFADEDGETVTEEDESTWFRYLYSDRIIVVYEEEEGEEIKKTVYYGLDSLPEDTAAALTEQGLQTGDQPWAVGDHTVSLQLGELTTDFTVRVIEKKIRDIVPQNPVLLPKNEDGLYDLSDRLRMHGWQVPAYPLPDGAEEVTVQRIVCRADLTFNLAEAFVTDFRECLEDLKHAHVLCNEEKSGAYGFTH